MAIENRENILEGFMLDTSVRVLVADDMKTMRKIIMKSLKALGYSDIIEAADGVEALKALNSSEVEVGLILSDWNMPNCTGYDFLKRVRADSKYGKVPFILITAENEASQVKDALAAGVNNYIVKPFDVDTLKTKLEDVYKKIAA